MRFSSRLLFKETLAESLKKCKCETRGSTWHLEFNHQNKEEKKIEYRHQQRTANLNFEEGNPRERWGYSQGLIFIKYPTLRLAGRNSNKGTVLYLSPLPPSQHLQRWPAQITSFDGSGMAGTTQFCNQSLCSWQAQPLHFRSSSHLSEWNSRAVLVQPHSGKGTSIWASGSITWRICETWGPGICR